MSKLVKKKQIINYEQMVQSALRGVVKSALTTAAKDGLPGSHHFYITFATDHPEVDLPDYLMEEYPDGITIVLQHEFWDLEVEEDRFAVTLCFNDVNERLLVPYDAIISFVDPSVKFGLEFTPIYDEPESVPEVAASKKSLISKKKDKAISIVDGEPKSEESNIVTLDAFRKK